MKICIAGKNQIAVNSLKYLMYNCNMSRNDLLVCLNKNDFGISSWQPSLKLFADDNDIKAKSLNELYEISDLIFISLEFDKIISPNKFQTERLYNIHFSLLPAYKGMYTSVFPLLNGEKYTGVTLHEIDEGIDTGNIIAQEKIDIDINDTCRDVYFKYLKHSQQLFIDHISDIINNRIISYIQNPLVSTYYSKQAIDFSNIVIDFNKTSFQIHNQIRAYIFEEYQLPSVKGKRVIKSYLTSDKIGKNYFASMENKIILSGIDGYKIILDTK